MKELNSYRLELENFISERWDDQWRRKILPLINDDLETPLTLKKNS